MPRQASPGFQCTYPPNWESCNNANDRKCWVKDPSGKVYDIKTDYEDNVPEGIERPYNIDITQESISPDGTVKPLAQLINGKYPGKLIEACWGDTLVVNVRNQLPTNGTTIHWHGLRLLHQNEQDGVNGVTQCPIAENDTFQYKFKLTQYGHTWYHSHYSSQYSDGVAAPLLIHGPNSDEWDEEWTPIIVADWFHASAYHAFADTLRGVVPPADSILVNGTGRYYNPNGTVTGQLFQQSFEPGKKYLIRLINGGTDFHFHFSIDNHKLKVVSGDFVPVTPYEVDSLSIGIGQRYSVIVEAKPTTASSNNKYWVRTEYTTAGGCNFAVPNVPADNLDRQRTGIISYTDAGAGDPTSTRHGDTIGCVDLSSQLSPIVEWTVSDPLNEAEIAQDTHDAGLDLVTAGRLNALRWELADTPLWLNFSDPTILNLDNSTWNPEYAIQDYDYSNNEQFVYMVVNSGSTNPREKVGGHHPIHLHGHDFAIVAQGAGRYAHGTTVLNKTNPMRRDVAMLPAGGHLVLAFKPDNPGVWIMHCHIAWHAGSGLALQVVERQGQIESTIGPLAPVRDGCNAWDSWMAANPDKFNYGMQEDSGV
ncbi:putative laccase precursor [Massariosphaeria phaeospora]|uniref:Putative laccase n=1 Tax=Massariosphaeria phaeospora TaxID=100035 RepID=A0A7C8IM33_9PLEO|nr:putative laccase precursor [Massariosphaeria phaeospora]